jgi:hypothetical protein
LRLHIDAEQALQQSLLAPDLDQRDRAGSREHRSRCARSRRLCPKRGRRRLRELHVQRWSLHLAKTCPTPTVVSAYGDITGLTGQTFASASFTLANAAQCQGGSPRFNIFTTTGTFFLGCNNVTPTTNGDGTLTYTFDAASIAAAVLPFPTGTITDAAVLLDVQGAADVSAITVNGALEVPAPVVSAPPTSKSACKHGGWKSSPIRRSRIRVSA